MLHRVITQNSAIYSAELEFVQQRDISNTAVVQHLILVYGISVQAGVLMVPGAVLVLSRLLQQSGRVPVVTEVMLTPKVAQNGKARGKSSGCVTATSRVRVSL